MDRFVLTLAGRNLPKVYLGRIATQNSFGPPACNSMLESRKGYSTKASVLKKVVPEFWIMKMKTGFAWNDVNGDGYITEEDFASWIKEMTKLAVS